MAFQGKVRDVPLVVGIDFGTSYSGYAFHFYDPYKKDPTKIDSPQPWNSGRKNLISMKTPTSLLLNERKEPDKFAFGFEAEQRYMELCMTKTNHLYYFFRRFKMQLQDGKADIQSEKLEIALEPEAASIFCQCVPVSTWSGKDELIQFAAAPPGTKYMVVDLGGGTADMTVHEKLDDGRLKELSKASGGPWGGTMVDTAFRNMLISIVRDPVMNKFKMDHTYHYLDLFNEFEAAKRNFEQGKDIIIKLPSHLNIICKAELGNSFKEVLEKSDYSKEIDVDEDYMKIKSTLLEKLFRQATDKIVDHMKRKLEEDLEDDPEKDISQILMVGGFSESPFVQQVIREAYGDQNKIKIIIPKDAAITIAKGAVLFGRLPQIIESRGLRFTYGLRMAPIFNEETHPEEKKFKSDTGLRCNDVFDIILSAGSEVKNELSVKKTYFTVYYFQKEMQLDVYYTKENKPGFTTDPGCKLLGGLKVQIPNPSKDQHEVDIMFQFGMTELKLSAQEKSSELHCKTTLPMIEDQIQQTLLKDCSN